MQIDQSQGGTSHDVKRVKKEPIPKIHQYVSLFLK